MLSDYKTAIVSTNVTDTRHELEQYLSRLSVTDNHATFLAGAKQRWQNSETGN